MRTASLKAYAFFQKFFFSSFFCLSLPCLLQLIFVLKVTKGLSFLYSPQGSTVAEADGNHRESSVYLVQVPRTHHPPPIPRIGRAVWSARKKRRLLFMDLRPKIIIIIITTRILDPLVVVVVSSSSLSLNLKKARSITH